MGFLVFDLIFKYISYTPLKLNNIVLDLAVLLLFRCGDLVIIECH